MPDSLCYIIGRVEECTRAHRIIVIARWSIDTFSVVNQEINSSAVYALSLSINYCVETVTSRILAVFFVVGGIGLVGVAEWQPIVRGFCPCACKNSSILIGSSAFIFGVCCLVAYLFELLESST